MTFTTLLLLLIPGALMVFKLAAMAFAIAWIARSIYQPKPAMLIPLNVQGSQPVRYS